MLTCFGCHLYLPPEVKAAVFGPNPNPAPLIDHVLQFAEATPLEILAYELLQQPDLRETAKKLFGAYDRFLALLGDPEKRERLKSLPRAELGKDPVFTEVRKIGGEFEAGLLDLFFGPRSRLAELTKLYGVF